MSHEFNQDEWQNIQDRLEQASKTERERIIKLLEENTGCGYQHRETEKCFCDAIALIKGENK
jgi:hypothetical protein